MDILDFLFNLFLFPRTMASVFAAIVVFFVANRYLGDGVSLALALTVGVLLLCLLLVIWPLRGSRT